MPIEEKDKNLQFNCSLLDDDHHHSCKLRKPKHILLVVWLAGICYEITNLGAYSRFHWLKNSFPKEKKDLCQSIRVPFWEHFYEYTASGHIGSSGTTNILFDSLGFLPGLLRDAVLRAAADQASFPFAHSLFVRKLTAHVQLWVLQPSLLLDRTMHTLGKRTVYFWIIEYKFHFNPGVVISTRNFQLFIPLSTPKMRRHIIWTFFLD